MEGGSSTDTAIAIKRRRRNDNSKENRKLHELLLVNHFAELVALDAKYDSASEGNGAAGASLEASNIDQDTRMHRACKDLDSAMQEGGSMFTVGLVNIAAVHRAMKPKGLGKKDGKEKKGQTLKDQRRVLEQLAAGVSVLYANSNKN